MHRPTVHYGRVTFVIRWLDIHSNVLSRVYLIRKRRFLINFKKNRIRKCITEMSDYTRASKFEFIYAHLIIVHIQFEVHILLDRPRWKKTNGNIARIILTLTTPNTNKAYFVRIWTVDPLLRSPIVRCVWLYDMQSFYFYVGKTRCCLKT